MVPIVLLLSLLALGPFPLPACATPSSVQCIALFEEHHLVARFLSGPIPSAASPAGFVPLRSRPPIATHSANHSSDFVVLASSQSSHQDSNSACDCSCLWSSLASHGIRVNSVTPDTPITLPLPHSRKSADVDVPCNATASPSARSLNAARQLPSRSPAELLDAHFLWKEGITGSGIKVAVLDTGIDPSHHDFRRIRSRSDLTSEHKFKDLHGHGTFVSGIIASTDESCRGIAPDAEIHMLRVFAEDQRSYTSWFLNAFNQAISLGVHILNLSIGGPDFFDSPFVHKVNELTGSGIAMVSAIGNDGPSYGTLNNPADQPDVIGVGGLTRTGHIAPFSSRGMTAWEIPGGYGRVKPDVVAPAQDIAGPRQTGGCKVLSGTSVASPLVAGAAALLASVLPESDRQALLNPASIKYALLAGAQRVNSAHMYEQGAGSVDLLASKRFMEHYKRAASAFPSSLDLAGGYYWWPLSRQPVYNGAMPTIVNITLLNGLNASGHVVKGPIFEPSNGIAQETLDVAFEYSPKLSSWCGYLAVYISVRKEPQQHLLGVAEGHISLTIESGSDSSGINDASLQKGTHQSNVSIPLRVEVVHTPPREKRVLWDQFHNVQYPPAYVPRDNLGARSETLDWHGDHPHTNFHLLFDHLIKAGYFVEVLGSPLSCFHAEQYGALLLVDPEEEYFKGEIEKLRDDVEQKGLGLIVFAEWYNGLIMDSLRFFDDNTQKYWYPATGGANIPALNDLLEPYGISFSDHVVDGTVNFRGRKLPYRSGTTIRSFPQGGTLQFASLAQRTGFSSNRPSASRERVPIAGTVSHGSGEVFVFGDTTCLDVSNERQTHCFELLVAAINHVEKWKNEKASGDEMLTGTDLLPDGMHLQEAFRNAGANVPTRNEKAELANFSKVLRAAGEEPQCNSGTLKGFEMLKQRQSQKRQASLQQMTEQSILQNATPSERAVTSKEIDESTTTAERVRKHAKRMQAVASCQHWVVAVALMSVGTGGGLAVSAARKRRRRKRGDESEANVRLRV